MIVILLNDNLPHMIKYLFLLLFAITSQAQPLTQKELNGVILTIPRTSMGKNVDLTPSINKIKKLSQKAGVAVMPSAIAIGSIARCQAGLGLCMGEQASFTVKNNHIEMSTYTFYGLEAGVAEYAIVDFYVAFCYGKCNGAEAEGNFVSFDGGGAFGLGGNGFIEVGSDIEDLFKMRSINDVVNSGVFYIGIGIAVGEGAGISLGAIHYQLANIVKIHLPKN